MARRPCLAVVQDVVLRLQNIQINWRWRFSTFFQLVARNKRADSNGFQSFNRRKGLSNSTDEAIPRRYLQTWRYRLEWCESPKMSKSAEYIRFETRSEPLRAPSSEQSDHYKRFSRSLTDLRNRHSIQPDVYVPRLAGRYDFTTDGLEDCLRR
ncbi:hypothetical protein CROQUDRAFT_104983 [Cronartium quercuum f. sp. fusiforme G11]|uniref:Uncharacterized protein n=1 Tax=Cronartium quercuum f. sp. fusiforme G11 TaxID=708437 RepID=A0A9P6TGD0_9BASI|nr:hypothetical protein CROQUDRAFT_104983 [Cronartium quercuum f. sp. fusiforme G11]